MATMALSAPLNDTTELLVDGYGESLALLAYGLRNMQRIRQRDDAPLLVQLGKQELFRRDRKESLRHALSNQAMMEHPGVAEVSMMRCDVTAQVLWDVGSDVFLGCRWFGL